MIIHANSLKISKPLLERPLAVVIYSILLFEKSSQNFLCNGSKKACRKILINFELVFKNSNQMETLTEFVEGGFGEDAEEKLALDEEGGGWDVGDDDLELPPDMVRNDKLISGFSGFLKICNIWELLINSWRGLEDKLMFDKLTRHVKLSRTKTT